MSEKLDNVTFYWEIDDNWTDGIKTKPWTIE